MENKTEHFFVFYDGNSFCDPSLQRAHELFNFMQEFLGNIGDGTAINSR